MRPLLYYGVVVIFLVAEGFAKPTCTKEKNLIKDKQETSCNHLGLTTVPLTIIDIDTEILLLSYNSMKSISTSVFESLPQLVELDLSNNGMSAIKIDYPLNLEDLNLANNSFDHLPELSLLKNLVKLDLSNNDIASVPDTAFHGLSRLKELHLQGNKITKLSEQAFQGLTLLDTLDLSFNQITSVPPQLISDLVKMAKFYLRGNSLSHIPDGFFDGLDVSYVYLDLNPWKCTCNLKYFKKWVEDNAPNIYTISDGSPENDDTSVVCTNNVPLLDFELPCRRKGDEDPATPEFQIAVKTTTTLMRTTSSTPLPLKAMTAGTSQQATTPTTATEMMTTSQPTTFEITTKIKTTSQPTTPAMTTETTSTSQPTTPAMTTETTSTRQPTTPAMTTETTSTRQPTTPAMTTETTSTRQPSTSGVTTKVQTTLHLTTTVTTSAMKTSQSTKLVMTTQLSLPIPQTTTLAINATEIENTTTSHPALQQATTFGQETETPRYTMAYSPELFPSMSKRRSWLEETIIKHCCFLHLLIYSIILFLLLLQMVVCLVLLTWACTSYRHYFQILRERVPRVRLIRYSWRTLQDKDDILLVHGGNSDFGQDEPIPMLVLEPGSRDYSKSYTPAILT